MNLKRLLLTTFVSFAIALSIESVWPQSYPVKPVRIIVPYSPGATLILSRGSSRNEIAKYSKVIKAAGIKPE